MTEMKHIRRAISKKYFKPHVGRALWCTGLAFGLYFLSFFFSLQVVYNHITYLYPVTWFLMGTMITGFYVLAHDCGHYPFLINQRITSIIGHIFLMPTFIPFYSWKYTHDPHHRYTNLRTAKVDTVDWDMSWNPISKPEYRLAKRLKPRFALAYRMMRTILPFASLYQLWRTNFRPSYFKPEHRFRVRISILVTVLSAIGFLAGSILWGGSLFLFLHLFIFPGLIFHAWLALYTFVQHTSDDSTFYEQRNWTLDKGILGTINCYFPRIISYIHFNVDIHLPHHISPGIPCYYLRDAMNELKQSRYKSLIREKTFSIPYLIQQIKACKLWDSRSKKWESSFTI